MTNRLLIRYRDQDAARHRPASSGRPRILVFGIIGLVGVVGLGLLAVPVLIGTNASSRPARAARVSRPARPGSRPAAPRPSRSRPTTCSGTRRSGSSTACRGRSWPASGRWKATTASPPCPACTAAQNGFGAAGPMQIGIGGAAGNAWGGAPVHPASQVVNGVATDEDGGAERGRLQPRRRDRGRGQVPAGVPGADQPLGGDLRLQPPAVLRAERAVLRGPVRGRQLLGGVRGHAGGQFGGRLRPRPPGACPPSRRRPRPWPPPSPSPSSSSASRTCGAAPGRTPSTAPAW